MRVKAVGRVLDRARTGEGVSWLGAPSPPVSMCALALALCAALALAWCGSAWGLAQRGHVFGSTFGSAGSGAGGLDFEGPFRVRGGVAGVAVDEATGDVYVVDRGNHRLDVFGPSGSFVAAWGWGVSDGKAEYEVCASECRAGLAGSGKGEFKEPGAVAVDNAPGGDGEVFVDVNAGAKRPVIERFPADGERPLGRLPVEEEGQVEGIATDGRGRVWVYRGEEEETGEVEGFTSGSSPVSLDDAFLVPVGCPKAGLAVDASGEGFYVDHELLDGEGECPAVVEREREEIDHRDKAEGQEARPVLTARLAGQELVSGELDRESTTGVAVDQASGEDTPLGAAAKGDVYLDNGSSIAELSQTGTLLQRFGSERLQAGGGVAIDSSTGDLYVVDEAADRVDVFEPQPSGQPPAIDALWAQATGADEAQLNARIDPQGTPTSYYFQYGTAGCEESSADCTDAPGAPGAAIGGGFGDVTVSQTVAGLAPNTTYYYRVIAENSLHRQAQGPERFASVTTPPSASGLLADGRAWELVSPAEKDGSGIEPAGSLGGVVQASPDGDAVVYVADGPVVGEPEGSRAPEPTQVLSTRSGQGWSSQDLTTPHGAGEGLEIGEPWEYRFFSSDLAVSLLEPPFLKEPAENPPLAPGVTEKTVYARADLPPEGSADAAERQLYGEAGANSGFLAPGYLPLVSGADDTSGEPFGGRLEFLDATADATHVLLEAGVPLVAGATGGLYEWSAASDHAGGLQLVSVLPDGQPAGQGEEGLPQPELALGDRDVNVRGALSEDGARVVFYAETREPDTENGVVHGLYLRDAQRGETVQVNRAQGVVEPTGEESEVAFQGASSDGSRIFFTDTAPLTAESRQQPSFGSAHNPADLYEFEVTSAAGEPLSGRLTDITPAPEGGSADVLNLAPAISRDGTYVYFVANGMLTPNAVQGNCPRGEEAPAPGAQCNLYVEHERHASLIAVLSAADAADWGSTQNGAGSGIEWRADFADVTAGASPDGQYFAFMSNRPLTGYDNEDANIAGVRDQEVYLYDAQTRLLVCASCQADGARPAGAHDVSAGNYGGPLVDRREDHQGQYLAGSIPGWIPLSSQLALEQPRYISNNGRLFFNSPLPLVPQAGGGQENVYEYEPGGEGTCAGEPGCVSLISSGSSGEESAFIEASEGGGDAFFITAQPLAAADHDSDYDLYDARTCALAEPCITSEATGQTTCETAKTCNPTTVSPPSVVLPASDTAQSSGNAEPHEVLGYSATKSTGKPKPLTRAQKLALALKACRKHRHKRERVRCETQARRRYAPKPRPKRGHAHKGADPGRRGRR